MRKINIEILLTLKYNIIYLKCLKSSQEKWIISDCTSGRLFGNENRVDQVNNGIVISVWMVKCKSCTGNQSTILF